MICQKQNSVSHPQCKVLWNQCKIQKNWCTVTVAPTIEHHGGHSSSTHSPHMQGENKRVFQNASLFLLARHVIVITGLSHLYHGVCAQPCNRNRYMTFMEGNILKLDQVAHVCLVIEELICKRHLYSRILFQCRTENWYPKTPPKVCKLIRNLLHHTKSAQFVATAR